MDVSNTKVFRDASTYPYVLVLQKEPNASTRDNNTIEARKVSVEESLQSLENFYEIEQKSFLKSPNLIFSINFTREITRILDKVNDSSLVLEDLCEMKDGIHTGNVREKLILDNKANDQCKRLLTAESIDRYSIDWKGLWVDYRKDVIDEAKNEYASLRDQRLFEAPEKLLTALFGLRPEVAYDSERFYANNSVKIILAKNKDVNLKYVMAVLNSTLMAFYYRTFYSATHVGSGYIQFYPQDFLRLPIKKPTEAQLSAIVELVDQFLTLKKRVIENKDMMNGDAKQLEEEVRRMDSAIDDMVYKTYGITESEKLTIVNCLPNQ